MNFVSISILFQLGAISDTLIMHSNRKRFLGRSQQAEIESEWQWAEVPLSGLCCIYCLKISLANTFLELLPVADSTGTALLMAATIPFHPSDTV